MTQSGKDHEWVSTLTGEMLLFGLLGKILYEEPDKGSLQPLLDNDIFSEAPLGRSRTEVVQGLSLLRRWDHQNRSSLTDQTIKTLKQDYTRLFIGLGQILAPPWESVYFSEERLVFQEQTLRVRTWYRRFNLEPEKLHREPDDHIGLEFAFLSHLAYLGLAALEDGDQEEFQITLEAQRQFIMEHPLKWVSIWASRVEQHAQTDFYRGIGFLTKGALLEMASILNLEIPTEVQW